MGVWWKLLCLPCLDLHLHAVNFESLHCTALHRARARHHTGQLTRLPPPLRLPASLPACHTSHPTQGDETRDYAGLDAALLAWQADATQLYERCSSMAVVGLMSDSDAGLQLTFNRAAGAEKRREGGRVVRRALGRVGGRGWAGVAVVWRQLRQWVLGQHGWTNSCSSSAAGAAASAGAGL